MRLLHLRHPDQRRRAAAAQSRSERGRGARGARPQSLPLRRPQPHGPRGAAGREGGAARMSAAPNAPAPVSAQGAVLFPGNLRANPRLSQWLGFSLDGIVEVSPGKVEIGQGILTALAQIVADELDVELARVRLVPATTARSPNEGVTSGSLSVQDCGVALRYVCAEARAIFLAAAAERLGVRGRRARGRGRHHHRARQRAHELLGAGRRGLARPRRHLPAPRRSRPPRAASPARPRPASTSPTRCSGGRASSTICACPACCMAACSARTRRARR